MLYVLLAIPVVVVLVLVIAARKPDRFRTERSALIDASAERIFPMINDFRAWPTWSPWEKKDPDMKRSLSGAASGPGSIYAWDGNRNIGAGRMEILDVAAPERVTIQLDFFRPFKARNTAEFTLKPEGAGTRVTWAMFGPQPFVGKLISMFIDCDRMVGKEFETGLANLKAEVGRGSPGEARAAA
ncbi:MAG: SRPBCC family protein [Phreatobacter sp.]|uniref:SRPBCC family protein n=1 Tax=Phreatobacter sp. TaxID=1966341 RepID=UPI001A6050FB|nr:SRPBCC family protein [Phreatobacter sp.]MBL8569396.1 SRPBCC family protein [Phreatobacter sp.]